MKEKYIHIYNNLINYTRNKDLYKNLTREDNFSDRLTLFLLHFSFFLKNYKNDENKKILQEIYDYNFRQLELSIREVGYGDQSINKKMKDYINLLHSMVSEIHFWDDLSKSDKLNKISNFLGEPSPPIASTAILIISDILLIYYTILLGLKLVFPYTCQSLNPDDEIIYIHQIFYPQLYF